MGADEPVHALVGKGRGLALKAVKALVGDGLRAGVLGGRLVVRHPGGEDARCIGVHAQPLPHVEVRAHERGVVRVAQRVVRDAGLLDLEMLHGAGEGLLVLVPAGLQVVDELEVDPAGDPVPIQIVDDDVLLQNTLVVAAPGQESHVLPAPGAKLLQRFGEGDTVGEPVLVKAGDLFDLVVHTPEVNGPDVDRKFLGGAHVPVQLHGADLDDFAAQVDGQLIENGGFGAHRLVPLQIHHDVIHRQFPHFLL